MKHGFGGNRVETRRDGDTAQDGFRAECCSHTTTWSAASGRVARIVVAAKSVYAGEWKVKSGQSGAFAGVLLGIISDYLRRRRDPVGVAM